MSQVKFMSALVSNLSIFDSAGYELMGEYAINLLHGASVGSNLQSEVASYSHKISRLVGDLNWIDQEAQNRAQRYSNLIKKWLRSPVRDDIEKEIITFLEK